MFTIYRISFPNSKMYIGLTKNLKMRINQHKHRGIKSSKALKILVNRAIAKYKGQIIFDVLEIVDSIDEAKTKEIYYIDSLNTYANAPNSNGYNMTKGGDKYSENHGMAIAEKLADRRPFLVFDKISGSLIGEWNLRYKCAIDLDICKQSIGQVLSGRRISCNNYTMIYKESYNGQSMAYVFSSWNAGIKIDNKEMKIKQVLRKGGRHFSAFNTKTGEFIGTWLNQAECVKDILVNRKHITQCLKGKRKTSGGYIFRYLD